MRRRRHGRQQCEKPVRQGDGEGFALELRADAALADGDYADARRLYRRAIAKDRGDWELWLDLALVSPYVLWYGAVVLIVSGHVIAVLLAHAAALRLFRDHRLALWSELPMTALMILYTMLSLWILAQPIVG